MKLWCWDLRSQSVWGGQRLPLSTNPQKGQAPAQLVTPQNEPHSHVGSSIPHSALEPETHRDSQRLAILGK